MDSPCFRHWRFTLCLVIGPARLAAHEPTPKAAPAADTAKPAAPAPALVLPTIEVRQGRIRKIDGEIRKLDKLIAREEKKVKSSELDKALNNTRVANAAALFGGNSAAHLSAVAASRVALLQTERDVLEAMKRPATREALAMMETELEQLRTTRRNLDNVAR